MDGTLKADVVGNEKKKFFGLSSAFDSIITPFYVEYLLVM